MALGDEPRELADNYGIPPALGFDYPSQQLYLGIRVLIRVPGIRDSLYYIYNFFMCTIYRYRIRQGLIERLPLEINLFARLLIPVMVPKSFTD